MNTTPSASVDEARDNRLEIESRDVVAMGPKSIVDLDRAVQVRTGHLIVGNGAAMRQRFTTDKHPLNSVLYAYGTGSSWHDPFVPGPSRNQIITTVAPHTPPGSIVYLWKYDDHPAGPQQCDRRRVVERSGSLLTLDASVVQGFDRIKWFRSAVAISDASENAATVAVHQQDSPPMAGTTVLVTSGPSLGLEISGEFRTVLSVSGRSVTLDRPLRMSYTQAALVALGTIDDVVIKDCVIDLPVNPEAESVFGKFMRGWRFERCRINRLAINNACDFRFTECDILGRTQLNACHDIRFSGCRMQSVAFEEGSHDCTVESSRIGPAVLNSRGQPTNCVSTIVGAERITIRDSHLLGAAVGGCQIYGGGRECVYEGLRLSGRAPCWVSGGMRLSGILSDGEINITGGGPVSISQVKSTNLTAP